MSQLLKVYALLDPYSLEARYVGLSQDPRARLSSHCSRHAAHALRRWVASLDGRQPIVWVMKTLPAREAQFAEIQVARMLHAKGHRLLNKRLRVDMRWTGRAA